jgi:HAD superfamily hydrolase (TIGR01450 family)
VPEEPVVCDLDGVIWLADVPIPGSAEAIARLRAAGHAVAFVTNNSSSPLAEIEAKLARQGIDAAGAVVGSAEVTAGLVEAGQRVLVAGGPGLVEALEARGAEVVRNDGRDPGPVDAVAVGFHRDFDYERLRVAMAAVRAGARLLASNDDATYPTPDGPIPGGGSILAAVERASGTRAVVAGKPYQAMADLIAARYGRAGLVVGDRPDTDGRLATRMGWRFGLVLSGVTTDPTGVDPRPELVGADLAAIADLLVG